MSARQICSQCRKTTCVCQKANSDTTGKIALAAGAGALLGVAAVSFISWFLSDNKEEDVNTNTNYDNPINHGNLLEDNKRLREALSFEKKEKEKFANVCEQLKNSNSGDVSNPSAVSMAKEEIICKICMVNEVDIVFVPCGHARVCRTCTSELKECPYCQKKIKEAIKLYQ